MKVGGVNENGKRKEGNNDNGDGVTTCCGYDFGVDGFDKKIKYCPICGKKIVIKHNS